MWTIRELYEYLETVGFEIHHSALSNYAATLYSISSSFGMGHHFYRGSIGNYEFLDSRKFITSEQNPVVRIFKNNGYQVEYVHDRDYLLTSGCFVDSCFPNVFLGELIDVLVPSELQSVGVYSGFIQKFLTQFDLIAWKSRPHFTYVHIDSPGHSEEPWSQLQQFRDHYYQRLQGANDQIAIFVHSILERDPGALIIINADHGAEGFGSYWDAPNELLMGCPMSLLVWIS